MGGIPGLDPARIRSEWLAAISELMDVPKDALRFWYFTRIGVVGTTTLTQPAQYTAMKNYRHFLLSVSGFIQNPGDVPANHTRRELQIVCTSPQMNIFEEPINFGDLLTTTGESREVFMWPGLQMIDGGAQMNVQFSNAAYDATWSGADKVLGVHILGCRVLT